jgi:hypothetical protein
MMEITVHLESVIEQWKITALYRTILLSMGI